MVVMLSVASPGGGEEGGKQPATEADQNARHKEQIQDMEEEYSNDFKPLVIDTMDEKSKMAAAIQDAKTKELLLEQMALFRENNPSDVEDNDIIPSLPRPQEVPVLSNTPNPPLGVFSDSSTPSGSRVNSPALSTASNSGGSAKSGIRASHPNKARRKTDKILPVDGSGEKFACPVCHKILVSNTELTKHIRSHNNGGAVVSTNSCTICGKVLSSQSSLDRHMLVHSGERPFKCKYCNMAFTTNGNMHRHTRIHEKEGNVNGDELSIRGSVSRAPRSAMDLDSTPHSQIGFSNPVVKHMRELTPSGSKRKLAFDESYLSQLHAAKRSAYPPRSMTRDFLMMSTEGRAIHATTPSPPKPKNESSFNTDEAVSESNGEYSCPSCLKKFVCRFAMQTHLATTHPNFSFTCSICPRSFTTNQELNLHKMDDHHCTAPAAAEDVKAIRKEEGESQSKGFHNLSFTEFTQEKFPLIAQAWCDKNNREASSIFHDFTCKLCKKAFPCQSALDIHKNTHAPENMNECKNCHACFPDGKALTEHMLSHTACKVVARVALSEGSQDKPQEIVSQEEFMASFGMKIQGKSPTAAQEEEVVEEKEMVVDNRPEARINNDYYPILQKMAQLHQRNNLMYSNSIKELMQKPNGRDNDFADIHQILSRFGGNPGQVGNDYHKSPMKAPYGPPHIFQPAFSMTGSSMYDGRLQRPASTESSPSMKLPVMVTNGFVPIQNNKEREDASFNGDSFQCKYCPDSFNNYKAYKSHIKSHLGQSPYKCNLCPYTSADKSTLIRHLRTHNGERPYQCRVCEFAFTTKANCERHIRKKHFMTSKKDIDDNISYNQYPAEAMSDDSFASPDTICKFCGEDFRYFRALKLHLRSHSSCTIKPFSCKICLNGFSTKAVCMRHIQKQHQEVEEHMVEEQIEVNKQLAGMVSDEYVDMEQSMGHAYSDVHTATPIVISPIQHEASKMNFSNLLPVPRPKVLPTFITSPIIDLSKPKPVPSAADADDDEQPLDFSMKTHKGNKADGQNVKPITIEPHHMSGGQAFERSSSNEQPMDLTMKSSPSPTVNQSAFSRLEQTLPRPSSAQLQVHIRSHTNERPFSCFYCSASFTIKTNLERHLKTRHPQKPSYIPDIPGHMSPSSEDQQNDISENEGEGLTPLKSLEMITQSRNGLFNGSDDSSCELSSVNKILDVTNSNQFKNFLGATSEQNTPEPQANPAIPPFSQYQKSDEETNDMFNGSEPEGEIINVKPCVPDSETIIQTSPDSLPIIKIRNPKVPEKNDDPSSPAKKKRNSYADSPHKLMCPYCPRAFPWISSLNRHILTHTGQKPFKCPQCPVMFSTKSNRERHLVRKHGLNVLDPMTRQLMDRPFKCHLCVFSSFSTGGNLKKHYMEKHSETPVPEYLTKEEHDVPNELYTTECSENTKAAESSNAKRLDFGDEDEDDEDSKGDSIHDGLGQKLMDQIQPTLKSSSHNSRATTPVCLTTFSPEPTPPGTPERQHINPEKDNYNADKITECWKCLEDFGTRKNLLRHLKEHNIDLPFKCYLCDASFDNRKESLEHACHRHPPDWVMLKDKNQVNDINEFADCMNRIVEQNFIGNNNFGKKLTKAELEKYKVPLVEDMKPESDYVQRKVYCSLCPKRFWSLQDLRRHMRSHTGERPFECDICQKRFTLKHSMMRHRRRHAAETGQSPNISDDEVSSSHMDNALSHPATLFDTNKGDAKPIADDEPAVQPSSISSGLLGGLGSDLLHNLLGVDDDDIDEMISSKSADQAAKVLGVNH